MNKRMRQTVCVVIAAMLGPCAAGTAVAQAYPTKPIRVIAAGTPGGSIDFIARIVSQKASGTLGQQMIVDNRGGGGGNLGAEMTARSAPDGYTVLLIGASLAINPSLYSKLAYDPAKDFAPITQTTASGFILAVPAGLAAKSVKDLVALAKSKKDGMAYASPGSGQAQHLGMELFATRAGFKAVHIPYKGGAPAVSAVVSGESDVTLASVPSALPLLQAGKLKSIAVSSLKRIALLPEVPTVAESGFPGFEVSGWIGYLAPAGTPRDILKRLHEEIAKGLRQPDVQETLKATGQETVASTPDEFAVYIRTELIKWDKVAKQSGAKVD
ncbi:MAG: tripartite tricarboxylate transporter substrate binding protein [Burkholderiales bacterium]